MKVQVFYCPQPENGAPAFETHYASAELPTIGESGELVIEFDGAAEQAPMVLAGPGIDVYAAGEWRRCCCRDEKEGAEP